MNSTRFPDDLSEIYKEFFPNLRLTPLKTKSKSSCCLLESDNYCIKSSVIREQEIFQKFCNLVSTLNNCLAYKVLRNKNNEFLFHYDNSDIFAYEKIEGCTFTFDHENVSLLGRSLALLHNLMDFPDYLTNNSFLENMISTFLLRDPNSLYNGLCRKRYVLDYMEANPDILDKPTNVIHGDMWSENIIFFNKKITFIDFDRIHVFYRDYEVMRCFFISLLSSFFEKKKSIIAALEEYKDYFISYVSINALSLTSAFDFYTFVLCLECDVEDKAQNSVDMLLFFKKRQFLLLALIEGRKEILTTFNSWIGGLNVA
ncbi:phosphotransferase [Xenorhabdus bovienii]|uniref:phosphotransferase n=1 Tax=Xenorhabdus bovienii TaxID=40576 RepID=UPI00301BC7CC|nr:phosphotransferase [Xenorhabdus bovienii]